MVGMTHKVQKVVSVPITRPAVETDPILIEFRALFCLYTAIKPVAKSPAEMLIKTLKIILPGVKLPPTRHWNPLLPGNFVMA